MPYTMRATFGISLSNRAVLFGWASLDDLLDAAQIAERSGYFHSVWVGDNLLSKPRAEAVVTLSAIAARTEQVKLGTICLASFPLRDPVLFAIPRTAGWIAQWEEMLLDPEQKIARPRQIYTGPRDQDYVPIDQRGDAEEIEGPAKRPAS